MLVFPVFSRFDEVQVGVLAFAEFVEIDFVAMFGLHCLVGNESSENMVAVVDSCNHLDSGSFILVHLSFILISIV